MEKMRARTQIENVNVEIGNVICLLVGINPKRDAPGFIPEFIDYDPLAEGLHTIRIYIPNDDPGIQEYEIWRVRITRCNVSRNKKTLDGRKYLYVNVDVISKKEYVEHEVDDTYQNLLINRKSGYRILETKKLPLSAKQGWFRDGHVAVHAWIYFVGNKAAVISRERQTLREAYIHDLMKTSKKISQKTAIAAFNNLPPLPEITPLSEITL